MQQKARLKISGADHGISSIVTNRLDADFSSWTVCTGPVRLCCSSVFVPTLTHLVCTYFVRGQHMHVRGLCSNVKSRRDRQLALVACIGVVQPPLMLRLRIIDSIRLCKHARTPRKLAECPFSPSSSSAAFSKCPRCQPVSGSRVRHYHPIACRPCSTTQMCNTLQTADVRLFQNYPSSEVCAHACGTQSSSPQHC